MRRRDDPARRSHSAAIEVTGARQHNLKGIDVSIPVGAITAITGVSGSGKSSLAFDTLYAEGQRRYVESFSPYARQFMDRMDRPAVGGVRGMMPAVAIDQKNTIKASRSTVGTVTELTDFIKLLWARVALLHCDGCGAPVSSDEPGQIAKQLLSRGDGRRAVVTFTVPACKTIKATALALQWLLSEGYQRLWRDAGVVAIEPAAARQLKGQALVVVVDRLQLDRKRRQRLVDSLETAMLRGRGRASVELEQPDSSFVAHSFSRGRHCARCDRSFPRPLPNHFSFNSPLGACETCNGFGAVIGLDLDLVIPDPRLSLDGGAIRPWNTERTEWERDELRRFCRRARIPTSKPWAELSPAQRALVVEGDRTRGWHGIRGWFAWLEGRTYKMHVRVLLSRYRAYQRCPRCQGARLNAHGLSYRLAGLTLGQVYGMTIGQARSFFEGLALGREQHQAAEAVLREICSRLRYLCEVGVDYLTLERQSRTLSGGEVQRVNLTTAIGSGLVNTLYVLDEPSVGLHPRDNQRLMAILERLRANRNTIVIVEHDEAIIARCDHVVDLGPGPGEAGGEVVYAGPPAGLCRAAARSATARWLCDGERARASEKRPVSAGRSIVVRGAREHNLAGIDVAFPRERLTVVTGVSGAGKSTLVQSVLYRGLMRQRGRPVDPPGQHQAIDGAAELADVVLVDQSPVGTTPRSNPATYVKAFDPIRKLFAAQPRARRLGFSPGTFSFNVAGGRCESCEGNGFERIEMQFLSDRFVTCERCGGRRFKHSVLGVTVRGKSIDDVLQLTVDQAAAFFGDSPEIARPLAALSEVGLGYLRLGQPLNTLSGGEAQRLKLAAHLALHRTEGTLFLFDEPTTGLHLGDVGRLVDNLQRLVERQNTVVVIEHHLDVIAAADWIVDLGPEGGEGGGQVVAQGPPAAVAACDQSHTGRFLAARLAGQRPELARSSSKLRYLAPAQIVMRGVRVHNLQSVDLQLPRDRFVVISGPSGSGKSSLAFDVLFAEGQRRFIDCLSPYARQYVAQVGRPDLDELSGVPPTVCISQRTAGGGRKSTVATITEVYHYLRLVYARIGRQHCHRCGAPVSGLEVDDLLRQIVAEHAGQEVYLLAPAVRGRKGFHRDVLRRAAAAGQGEIRVDGRIKALGEVGELSRYREHDIEHVVARLRVDRRGRTLAPLLRQALELGDGTVYLLPTSARRSTGRRALRTYSRELYCAACGIGFDALDPRVFSFNSSAGACVTCQGLGVLERDGAEQLCQACDGSRLNPIARAVKLGGRSIADLCQLTAPELASHLTALDLDARQREIAGAALEEAVNRCQFLARLGLDYLALGRGAQTLSGGEAQRVRLAAQLSADLRGVLYLLDEPTIGLHPEDNERLLGALQQLVERGNSVVVVEHDEETIRRADHLVDLGPGGGRQGGRIVASGPTVELLRDGRCPTVRSLDRPASERAIYRGRVVRSDDSFLGLRGVWHHNLQGVDLDLPLGRFVVVTGVSGSGKSSLVRDALAGGLRRLDAGAVPVSGTFVNAAAVRRVREIDQSPIGKTPASTPSTYVGLHDEIRKLFAALPEARARGYRAGRFSFNVRGGRCEACRGQGQVKHEMSFLPDVHARCETCAGRRFNAQTLEVRYRERSIADVLELTVSEARELFAAVPVLRRGLELLQDIGLGYLQLGQPSNTLSGGEAQRIKLVDELRKEGGQGTLYVMDEPSTGLHLDDLRRLLTVLQRLVDRGDTLVVIEHNLDVIASADWLVDLGPGGGAAGGRLVYQGPRDGLLDDPRSVTARWLATHLRRRRV